MKKMSEQSCRLKKWLKENDVTSDFLYFDNNVHTVEQAVKESGHPVERFTKSIVLLSSERIERSVIIAMVPADNRVSTERVRKALQLEERPVIANEVESLEYLNQNLGGNSPLNAKKATVLIDPEVFTKDWILTGGGDDRSLVRISTDELKRVVDFTVERVRKY